jgi:hypothetical protein
MKTRKPWPRGSDGETAAAQSAHSPSPTHLAQRTRPPRHQAPRRPAAIGAEPDIDLLLAEEPKPHRLRP